MNTDNLLLQISENQVRARDQVISLLKEKGFKVKPKQGLKNKNNYNNYVWTEIEYSGRLFWITMFWNDVDNWDKSLSDSSGNYHTQIGRIQFWKDIVVTEKNRHSTNNVIKEQSSKDVVAIIVDKGRYGNPLDFMGKDMFKSKDCLNGKYITIDDIIENPKALEAVVNAFENFVKNS